MSTRVKIVRFLFTIVFLALLPFFSTPVQAGTNYFNEGPVYMDVGNTDYLQLDFMKLYGNLESMTNNQNSEDISTGTSFELWTASFYQSDPVGDYSSSDYLIDPQLDFTYSWSPATGTLSMEYDGSGKANGIDVDVDVKVYDAPYVDLIFHVENNSSGIIDEITFADSLGLAYSTLEEVLVPESPGIILGKDYFTDGPAHYTAEHPSYFADFIALTQSSGNLAIYTLWSEDAFTPTTLSLSSFGGTSDLTLQHTFDVWISAGETWTAPTIRLRLFDNFFGVTKDFRTDTGMDSFPSLETKLGDRYGQIVRSPLFHVDPVLTTYNFDEWGDMFGELPSPAIFMYSNFWEGGFHGYHPDYIPPDAEYGTTQELIDSVNAAHANGQLVMPFTLPSWWHEDSDTISNLPPGTTLEDISMLTEEGNPDYSFWSLGGQLDWGYFVSPFNSFVQTRIADAFDELLNDVGADLLYEDVVGARKCYWDFNVSNPDIMDCNGWYDHVETYKDTGIVTETGYDLFTKNAIGFLGSSHVIWSDLDTDFGAGNWRGFPFVQSLAHDKVMSYQYWADYTATKEALGWNMAMGFMLNYTLIYEAICSDACPEPMGSDWEDVVGDFQKYAVSRYAGAELTDFSDINEDNVTVSTFDDITVTRNWDETEPYASINGWEIPALGFITESDTGDLRAGVFSVYNGVDLEGDESYLIDERTDESVTVRMPLGEDTQMTIALPDGWDESDEYVLRSYEADGSEVNEAAYTVSEDDFSFSYVQEVDGTDVSYYKLSLVTAEPVDEGDDTEDTDGEAEDVEDDDITPEEPAIDTENAETEEDQDDTSIPASPVTKWLYPQLIDNETKESAYVPEDAIGEPLLDNPSETGSTGSRNDPDEHETPDSSPSILKDIAIVSVAGAAFGGGIILLYRGENITKALLRFLKR